MIVAIYEIHKHKETFKSKMSPEEGEERKEMKYTLAFHAEGKKLWPLGCLSSGLQSPEALGGLKPKAVYFGWLNNTMGHRLTPKFCK